MRGIFIAILRALALAGCLLWTAFGAARGAQGENGAASAVSGLDLAGFSKLAMEELHLKSDRPAKAQPQPMRWVSTG